MGLSGSTIIMSGGSRGIGEAIALRAARDGANVALLAKTTEPHPKLPGTIYTAAAAIEEAGGKALPLVGDVRDDDFVVDAVEQTTDASETSTSSSTTRARSTCRSPRNLDGGVRPHEGHQQPRLFLLGQFVDRVAPPVRQPAHPDPVPPISLDPNGPGSNGVHDREIRHSLVTLGLARSYARTASRPTPCGRAPRSPALRSKTSSARTSSPTPERPPSWPTRHTRSSPRRPGNHR